MHRFYINPEFSEYKHIELTDHDSIQKARQVLRLTKGDKIELFDGVGNVLQAEIAALSKSMLQGDVLSRETHERSGPYLVLVQAMPRAGKLDEIVRMCTEVGVDEFIFFESEYSVGKFSDSIDQKLERLHKIAVEASRQSERLFIPLVGVTDFAKVLSLKVDTKLVLVARNSASAKNMLDYKAQLSREQTILYTVGPEGGFSARELAEFSNHGFDKVFMNLPILRVETAAVVAAALLLH